MPNKVLHRVREGFTYAGDMDLLVMCCPVCGVTYAIPATLQRNAYDIGHRQIVWFCPNGHELGYDGPTESEQERDRLKQELKYSRDHQAYLAAQRDQALASARAEKAAKTRIKNDRDRIKTRVAHGVCPCCHRTFKALDRHMRAKHPDFKSESEAKPIDQD